MQNNSNLLGMVIQQALQNSHPSPLPANQPIIIPQGGGGGATVGDSVTVKFPAAMVWGSFTWGEFTWP